MGNKSSSSRKQRSSSSALTTTSPSDHPPLARTSRKGGTWPRRLFRESSSRRSSGLGAATTTDISMTGSVCVSADKKDKELIADTQEGTQECSYIAAAVLSPQRQEEELLPKEAKEEVCYHTKHEEESLPLIEGGVDISATAASTSTSQCSPPNASSAALVNESGEVEVHPLTDQSSVSAAVEEVEELLLKQQPPPDPPVLLIVSPASPIAAPVGTSTATPACPPRRDEGGDTPVGSSSKSKAEEARGPPPSVAEQGTASAWPAIWRSPTKVKSQRSHSNACFVVTPQVKPHHQRLGRHRYSCSTDKLSSERDLNNHGLLSPHPPAAAVVSGSATTTAVVKQTGNGSLRSNNSWLLNTEEDFLTRGWSTREKKTKKRGDVNQRSLGYGSFSGRNGKGGSERRFNSNHRAVSSRYHNNKNTSSVGSRRSSLSDSRHHHHQSGRSQQQQYDRRQRRSRSFTTDNGRKGPHHRPPMLLLQIPTPQPSPPPRKKEASADPLLPLSLSRKRKGSDISVRSNISWLANVNASSSSLSDDSSTSTTVAPSPMLHRATSAAAFTSDSASARSSLSIKSDVGGSELTLADGDADKIKQKPPPVDISAASNLAGGGGLKTPPVGGGRHDTLRDKERKIGHRRVGEGGQVTYKKIGTNQIMGSIQLGIHQAVGALANQPQVDVLIQDFYVVETISFPPSGSDTTPAHPYSDYRFKVYAPTAFRHFRNLFRIVPEDYLVSLCNEDLRVLSNPGASGSIFYLTSDDEFIIKTVQHKEAEFLQKLLPGYYMNLQQNTRTLLPKFFGLYTYQCNAKNIRLVIMNNLLPSSIKMHQKYDLKGSTYKRKANKYERGKSSPTYKDLDFMEHHPEGILLEADTYKALMNTLERDCRVLASFKIMDYSLLVGIHNLDQAAREKQEKANGRNSHGTKGGGSFTDGGGDSGGGGGAATGGSGESKDGGAATSEDEGEGGEGGVSGLSRSRSINRQRLVAHSTAMESIQADATDPIDEEDHVPPGGIPARNVKGERLLLFLGIIDILQSYRLKKKLEHTIKSMVTDGDTISVHRPNFYSQRFQKFMAEQVFKRIPSPLRHSPSRRRGGGASMRFIRPHSSSHLLEPGGVQSGGGTRLTAEAAAGGVGSLEASEDINGGRGGSEDLRSSTHHHHHVKSSLHHVTTVAIQEDGSDVVRKGQKLRFAGVAGVDSKGSVDSSSPPPPPVLLTKFSSSTISVSDVQLETRTDSRSTLSVDSGSGGGGSSSGGGGLSHGGGGHRSHTWTPPLSVEGSTPTWTEGTPSFTESSSSGDLGCPSTPVRSLNTTADSSHHETEMKHLRVKAVREGGGSGSRRQQRRSNNTPSSSTVLLPSSGAVKASNGGSTTILTSTSSSSHYRHLTSTPSSLHHPSLSAINTPASPPPPSNDKQSTAPLYNSTTITHDRRHEQQQYTVTVHVNNINNNGGHTII